MTIWMSVQVQSLANMLGFTESFIWILTFTIECFPFKMLSLTCTVHLYSLEKPCRCITVDKEKMFQLTFWWCGTITNTKKSLCIYDVHYNIYSTEYELISSYYQFLRTIHWINYVIIYEIKPFAMYFHFVTIFEIYWISIYCWRRHLL